MSFIEFNLTLETFIEDLKTITTKNEKKVEELLALKDKTYANFVKPFEMMDEYLDQFFTPLSHINAVNNSEKSQAVYADSLPILTIYSTKISQDINIYNAFKEIKNTQTLNIEQTRVVELNILNFEMSGAHLDDEKKKRLEEISLRKSELTNDFSQNILDDTNAFELVIDKKEDVEGISQTDLDACSYEEDGKTKYKFTLQMPSYIAYMTYGPSEKIREKLYKAYTTRAPQNADIIDELLKLREESAFILGFDNYASYSLKAKMANDTDEVVNFLQTLADSSTAQAKKELEVLKGLDGSLELKAFNTAYLSEKLKKRDYELDEDLYRPYFEQSKVVKGLFDFLNKLFGIEFKKVDAKVWDEKASVYDLYLDGKLRSRLLLDLEARKDKRGGAWMHNWQAHCKDENNKTQLASAFVVCNFAPSSPNSPSLLRHDDVVTLFHEMGHAIHHLLSTVDENGLSGVNGVEWDAVEFPSQLLENFAFEPQVLKMFASNYKTNEVLPDEMIQKLVKTKNFQSALTMLRQLEFSLFDFKLHMSDTKGLDVQKTFNKQCHLILISCLYLVHHS